MRLLKIASPPFYTWLIRYQYKTTPKIVSNSVSTQEVSWASLWWLDQRRLLAWQQIKVRILVPSKSWSLKPSPLRISGITIVVLLNGLPKQLLVSLFGGALPCSWHPFKAQWMGAFRWRLQRSCTTFQDEEIRVRKCANFKRRFLKVW